MNGDNVRSKSSFSSMIVQGWNAVSAETCAPAVIMVRSPATVARVFSEEGISLFWIFLLYHYYFLTWKTCPININAIFASCVQKGWRSSSFCCTFWLSTNIVCSFNNLNPSQEFVCFLRSSKRKTKGFYFLSLSLATSLGHALTSDVSNSGCGFLIKSVTFLSATCNRPLWFFPLTMRLAFCNIALAFSAAFIDIVDFTMGRYQEGYSEL